MKNIIRYSLIFLFTFLVLQFKSQAQCKVLKPEITGTYEGKCKNGLAHGKGVATGTDRYEGQFLKGLPNGYGTYTWAGGNVYTGEWIDGMRHGIGKYTVKTSTGDSVQNGLWQKDIYSGPKPRNPYVTDKTGVSRYDFQKNQTSMNRVLLDITVSGTHNQQLSNVLMSSSSGTETKLGNLTGYDFVVFPVTIKITYTSTSGFHSYPINVRFEFEIFEPGDWTVSIDN
ncbi:MAG: hypothetical protein WCR72_01555 [Bacteroidota bacterium]